ncbi:metallophosphoesterase family protein [Thalassoroseus pseudoceratinae]|uniref:metallophosphoesterase family protein n=1 Tax=Thalassoroseus pseudoceratinae TaxID=2713176 RepID=UPI0014229230|nr:metallophosphoesterase family protein [Thalassoroseus pseudoceratinae]
MKLWLFSDWHSDRDAAERLAACADNFDVIIGAGDFCNAHRGLERCLAPLKSTATPLVLVAGNNETTEELQTVCEGWPQTFVLHGSSVTIAKQTFFGLGGGVPVTPFGSWSYDLTEDQAHEYLASCPEGAVLISHSPPFGVLDVSSRRQHLGSQAVRECIERTVPRLVVCGHIHASGGQTEVLGSTPVVNAGSAGMEWTL